MNAALKKSSTVGERQNIASSISLMYGFRAMMKALRRIIGAGYMPTNPNRKNYTVTRIQWKDDH